MFDFKKFLKDYSITPENKNKNTGIGWINITCPFCTDTSNHLGFNYEDNYFSCWKCGWHSIESVIKALLPYENSYKILKKYDTNFIYDQTIYEKLNKKQITKIKLPGDKLAPIHINYLKNRNYNVTTLVKKYKLQGTTHIGNYRYRIIIPIFQNHKLVSFQARAINNKEIRYINCDPENEIIPIKNCLYNIDNCNNDYCVLTEGATKVWRLGDNSLATLGKNYTKIQLYTLVYKFKKIYVFLDLDAQEKAKKLCKELHNLGIKTYNIKNNISPDDMNQNAANILMKKIFENNNK